MNRIEPFGNSTGATDYALATHAPGQHSSPRASRAIPGQPDSTFTTITINTAKPSNTETGKPGSGDVDPHLFASAVAAVFCCGVLGVLALNFSIRSLSASEQQKPRAAKFYAEKAMSFAAASIVVGVFVYVVVIAALGLWYYSYYYW